MDILWIVTLAASVLVAASFVGIVSALLLGLVASFSVYRATKRRYWKLITALQFALVPLLWCCQVYQVTTGSSYVRNYNYQLDALANKAKLVGAGEDLIEKVLGKPTSVWKGWDRTDMETGMPTPDARFTTTYNYAPFTLFPYQQFQIHCEGGKVISTEMFDD